MDIRAFVGEEEVIKMNAELALRRDFTIDDIGNCGIILKNMMVIVRCFLPRWVSVWLKMERIIWNQM